ncbi:hypothetical protein DW1_2343 [Proteiniborus sp. DW1]|uniref:DUF4330 domain-containing protein n=1 Tax=Proteiniborus sp. DW1 TaxID=1889883 RepID=UPI00092DEBBD|nr:DUF4330 domain-containing protein [Proteiniborus sp. DW1]SCG83907.1 hypothetical protein DW1_2343 [Proteiniborus sp. DW1]
MKIIDDKGRIFGLINYIDLFIVLAFIIVLGRFVFIERDDVFPKELNSDGFQEVEILYYVKGVKDVSIKGVKIGDVFRDVTTNNVIGEVTNIDIQPSSIMTTDEKGKVVYSEIPDRFDMYLTIKGKGQVTDYDIKVANEEIKIGKTSQIQSRMNRLEAIIYGIEYN